MFGELEGFKTGQDPMQMDGVILAFVGDAVYELYVRNFVVATGLPKTGMLFQLSSGYAKASFQSESLGRMRAILTEEELTIVRRARNKKVTSKPKNASLTDYRNATAFEALIGYLYLKEEMVRLNQIMMKTLRGENKDE